jgi:hypothetical protein
MGNRESLEKTLDQLSDELDSEVKGEFGTKLALYA